MLLCYIIYINKMNTVDSSRQSKKFIQVYRNDNAYPMIRARRHNQNKITKVPVSRGSKIYYFNILYRYVIIVYNTFTLSMKSHTTYYLLIICMHKIPTLRFFKIMSQMYLIMEFDTKCSIHSNSE